MKKLEPKLRQLIEISPDKLPVLHEETLFTEPELFLMESLGLIDKHDRPDGGWWVNPSDEGLTYFVRKKQIAKDSRSNLLLQHLFTLLFGIFGTLFVEHFSAICQFIRGLFS